LLGRALGGIRGPCFLWNVMQTIGRKWKGRRGDFQARCAYCGVMWQRSKLWRDRSGNLVCPDEGSGKDATLLSELNAMHASASGGTSPVRDGGGYDLGGDEYRQHPLSILRSGGGRAALGDSICCGWWQPAQSGTLGSTGYRWVPNLQRVMNAGDVYQPAASLQPPDVSGVPTFSNDYLKSNLGEMLPVNAEPSIWIVGSATEFSRMFHVGSGVAGESINGIEITWNNDEFSAGATFATGSGNTNVFAAAPGDSGKHLVVAKMEQASLSIRVDDGDWVTTEVSGGLGMAVASTVVMYGGGTPAFPYGTTGTLQEAVLSCEVPSAALFTEMQKYFKRIYPELSI